MNREQGVTVRSVLVALALIAGANWLMRSSEFVSGRYITAGVPPVTAVGGLLILLLLNALLPRRRRFSRAELLVAYAGMCLGMAATNSYGVRAIFPYFSVLDYFNAPTNQFRQLGESLPGWYVLKNHAAVLGLYEGLPGKGVPWGAWRGLLVAWGSFLLMLYAGVVAICVLIRRSWMEHERLMFPVTQLPLALTDPTLQLWPSAVFWAGFALAGLVNASNIGHAFVETLPAFKPTYTWATGLTRPWTPLQSMIIFNRPELYGFAYWVPNEILLSGWLSYVLVKAAAVAGGAMGLDQPGFPFTQEQSSGGYVALALVLVYALRGQLRGAFDNALGRGRDDAEEPLSYRWALLLLPLSLGYCAWFLTAGGVPRWVAVAYLVLVFVFLLVYLRLRVEAGLALEFIYPYGYPRRMILYAFGPDSVMMASHGPSGLVAFYVAGFLARFHYPMWAGSLTLEGMRLAEAGRVPQRRMLRWLAAVLVIGVVLATLNYLTFNYANGLNYFEGTGGAACWRTRTVTAEYRELNNFVVNPEGANAARLVYFGGGGAVTLVLAACRLMWLNFPLHPVGYVLATAYGDTSPMWWPFLCIWAAKAVMLKYGGLRMYRRWLPFFVGWIVGHYLIGGLVWSLISTYATPDIASRYYTIFG